MTRKKLLDDSIAFSLVSALAVISASALNLYIVIRFGANYQADAFFVAYTVPGILATAMFSAMQVVLVPTFVRLSEARGSVAGGKHIVWLGVIGLFVWSGVALIGIAGGPIYVKAFTPGIAPAAQQIAVEISRWIFVVVPLAWVAGFLQSLLNSQQRFIFPLVSESLANILAVGILWIGGKSANILVVGLAFVAKMLAQILFSLLGVSWHIKIDKGITDISADRAEIATTFRGFGIRFGAALARQSSVTLERFWTANLATGTVSALSYAQMGVNMLSKIFSSSVATVLLPSLSQTTWQKTHERRGVSVDVLRLTLFLTIPVAAFSMIFSYPMSRIVMAFSGTSGDMMRLTARLLAIDVWRIPFFALLSVLLAPFYAAEDIKTPVNHILLMLGINLVLDVLLFYALGVYGFPLAAVLTDGISVIRAFWLQKRLDAHSAPFFFADLWRGIIGIIGSTGGAVMVAWLLFRFLLQWTGASMVGQVAALGIALLIGGCGYVLALWSIKIPEVALVAVMIKTIRARIVRR